MRDQDGAPLPLRQRPCRALSAPSPSKAPSTAARWRRSPPAARPKYLEGFGPKVDGFDQVAVRRHRCCGQGRSRPETAAILVEPVQGEGGIRQFPTQSLKRLRELCDKHGLLLIYDEVQCGIGRTGKLFAHEWSGVEPDLMAIAKGIGGGFPMGACLATDDAAVGMTAGVHGTTFGGNPLAMAVGNAVLDVVLERRLPRRGRPQGAADEAGAGGDRRRIPGCHRRNPRRRPDARPEMRVRRTPRSTPRCATRSCCRCRPATMSCGCCRR